jgi:EpsI family protein
LPAVPEGGAAPPAASWPAALLAMAVVAAAPLALGRGDTVGAAPLALSLPTPAGTQPLQGVSPLLTPLFPGAAAQAQRVYAGPQGNVTVHIAYFRDQGYRGKAVSSGNALMQPEDKSWSRASANRLAGSNEAMPALRVTELVSGDISQRRRLEVRQLYWVGGHYTHNDFAATALGVWGRVKGVGDDAAVVTIYSEGSADVTGPRLDAFVAAYLGTLANHLSEVQRQPRAP